MSAASEPRFGRAKKWFIIAAIVLITWVPGFVALAMLLTGNAG